MRKRVKKITEEIREYGVITMDHHLMDGLLKYACCESTTTADVDMTIRKVIEISEEEEGDALTMEHYEKIVGEPATATTSEA